MKLYCEECKTNTVCYIEDKDRKIGEYTVFAPVTICGDCGNEVYHEESDTIALKRLQELRSK